MSLAAVAPSRSSPFQPLCDRLGARVRLDEPMSRHTSFRIGGPADAWVEAESVDDIRAVQEFAAASGLLVQVLGGGTNVLVSDRGIRGVVLHLGRSFAQTRWEMAEASASVEAGAAVPFKRLVTESLGHGLAGLEFAEGIPGSLGGGLLMNAGAFGGEISDVLTFMEGVDPAGRPQRVPRADLRFGYRHFDLEPGWIVTGLGFALHRDDPEAILARRENARGRREKHQPVGFPNAGSVFRNPPGQPAGRLLDAAGLKGFRIGNAGFSDRHANFILNLGGARASEVRELMQTAIERVREKSGVTLVPEVKLLGEWEP